MFVQQGGTRELKQKILRDCSRLIIAQTPGGSKTEKKEKAMPGFETAPAPRPSGIRSVPPRGGAKKFNLSGSGAPWGQWDELPRLSQRVPPLQSPLSLEGKIPKPVFALQHGYLQVLLPLCTLLLVDIASE